jgi:hypothetical protein
MRRRDRLWFCGLLVALLVTVLPAVSASAATPTRFGAKLTKSTQADPFAEWCRDSNHSAKCTWVAVEAFENGDRYKAPRNGTIRRVRLISCVGGSFTVQVARARRSTDEAKIVRSGPTITYARDNRSECGGSNGDDYRIQSFAVNFHVNRNDFIAVKGNKVGFMRSSSSGPSIKFRPPLPTGGGYQVADSDENSLLIQFQYAS